MDRNGKAALQKLSDIESIVGIKDSSGDLDYFARLVGLLEQVFGPHHD